MQERDIKSGNGTVTINTTIEREREVLLLCKVATVFSVERTECNEEALVLFDNGSQLSFVSKELANRLKLEEIELKGLKVSVFGARYHTALPTMKTLVGIRSKNKESIFCGLNVVDYLTGELQVMDIPSVMEKNYQLESLTFYRRKPDILIEPILQIYTTREDLMIEFRIFFTSHKFRPHDLRKWISRRN
uniref:DUF1758 domain-containing protein n=1 Tax=Loa loa TaxID=7209 RepID=A0A1I7VNJ0_LOALO